jgi:hypothetical protein
VSTDRCIESVTSLESIHPGYNNTTQPRSKDRLPGDRGNNHHETVQGARGTRIARHWWGVLMGTGTLAQVSVNRDVSVNLRVLSRANTGPGGGGRPERPAGSDTEGHTHPPGREPCAPRPSGEDPRQHGVRPEPVAPPVSVLLAVEPDTGVEQFRYSIHHRRPPRCERDGRPEVGGSFGRAACSGEP